MDLASVFAEPLIELGTEAPAFAGIYTPQSFHGATKVGAYMCEKESIAAGFHAAKAAKASAGTPVKELAKPASS